jgi:microcystin-dependent protein
MATFKISSLTNTNSPTIDSVLPCVQNGVTKQISVLQIKNYLDDGTLRELSSGNGIRCSPNPITTTGSVSFYSPGLMSLYAGTSDPTGWLLCNGRSLVVSTYQDLFNKIGYRYGGTGANFNIPNMSGKAAFGLDDMGSTSSGRITASGSTTLGNSFGFETHALTDAQTPLVSHNHGTHYSTFYRNYGVTYQGNNSTAAQETSVSSVPSGGFRCYGLTVTINSAAPLTGSAHENLPPYLNLNWIIKI